MAKPTVVGKTEEDYGFRHQENCLLVPQGDATALADAVLWAFGHRGECRSIGSRGHCLYLDRFSVDCLSVELARVLMADVTV